MDPAPYILPDSEQVFVKVGYKVSNHMEKRTKQQQAKTVKQNADRFSKQIPSEKRLSPSDGKGN